VTKTAKKKTVAFYRKEAEKYEGMLNWKEAVKNLEKAIKIYPKHIGGSLADADIKSLKERLKADKYMLNKVKNDKTNN